MSDNYERSRQDRRARLEERKREKLRKERLRRHWIKRLKLLVPAVILIVGLIVIIVNVASCAKKKAAEKNSESVSEVIIAENPESGGKRPNPDSATVKYDPSKDYPYKNHNRVVDGKITVGDVEFLAGYTAQKTGSTISPPEEISQSLYSILIDASTGEIVAERDAYDRMYPASMTKVMTLLVAVEHLHTLDDKIIVSQEAADYSYSHGGSAVNWSPGEEITVKDLLYGCILSSGADACYDLAVYVAGDLDSFVELMNEKVEELGLSATTHFTNVAGFYDDNHYTTAYDMAMILKAAVENDLCREVMSAHTYTTPSTEEHPEGILISNWFLRRIEDKDSKGLVLCAKTGFVNQSGNCAASYMISNSGRPYLCVTGHAHSAWRAIYDHVGLYYNYTK